MSGKVRGDELIKRLQEKGYSKWRIAKDLCVSWQTVNLWAKGVFQPTPSHYEVLQQMADDGT